MNTIKNYLLTNLPNLNANGRNFINKLANGNDKEKRLLACIGIDIKHNLIDINNFIAIINTINVSTITDLVKYYNNITDIQNVYIGRVLNTKNDKLVRVLPLNTFRRYFYNKVFDDDKKNNAYEIIKEIERGNLTEFQMHNNSIGKGNLVWGTTYEEVKNLLDNGATINDIIINIGLGDLNVNKDYVLIVYPDDFNEKKYQPCHYSVNWTKDDNIFISNKNIDSYGRTRSNIGDVPNRRMKEIVHHSIDDPKYSYEIKHLGTFTDNNYDRAQILIETIRRF